jgi:leucyl aminopeptidase
VLKLGDFTGKPGETAMLPGAGGARRLLLLGCGDAARFDRAAAREFCQVLYTALNATQAKDALLHTADMDIKDGDVGWLLAYLARLLSTASYRYTETLAKPKPPMKLLHMVVDPGASMTAGAAQRALDHGRSTGLGINDARNLANLPGNICTPTYLAQQARKLGRGKPNLSVQVLDEKKMRELGMGSLLSVTAGSEQPAKLIVMNYAGAKKGQKPYVLVGKGITFDSGGISLKPGAKMDEMKFDMGGAASVFGTIRAITELSLPLNVVAIVAAAENMPSGRATKPGDVVTSMSGKTIEVLNTDAEGRLVLCDALTYAERFKPQAVIDIATLTGACVVALGSHATGLFANHLGNIGSPGGGSITAACFLSQFAEKYHWAHLDIAGSAWNARPKGATGRPVALLTRYLMDRAGV